MVSEYRWSLICVRDWHFHLQQHFLGLGNPRDFEGKEDVHHLFTVLDLSHLYSSLSHLSPCQVFFIGPQGPLVVYEQDPVSWIPSQLIEVIGRPSLIYSVFELCPHSCPLYQNSQQQTTTLIWKAKMKKENCVVLGIEPRALNWKAVF